MYVIDSADTGRIDEATEELQNMLIDEGMEGVPLLLFANKQDIDFAISAQEIAERMNLEKITDRKWSIFACSARTNEGIQEGFEWLVNSCK